ncbi:MAG: putative quinol monooxygenase [Chthoniobacterales bacterium]
MVVTTRALGFALIASVVISNLFPYPRALAEEIKPQVVRMAKLEIVLDQLENYKAALKEEIEASLRIEPGVLGLYAVSDKNAPTHITILEMYVDADAYDAHLKTAHFKNYKMGTKHMIKSLELMETEPILLGESKVSAAIALVPDARIKLAAGVRHRIGIALNGAPAGAEQHQCLPPKKCTIFSTAPAGRYQTRRNPVARATG